MKRRILSIITALAMCLSFCPSWAFAAEPEPDTGLCPHHTEHTAECGYIPPAEGSPCGHVHDETCGYVEAAEEVPCDMGCAGTDGGGVTGHAPGCAYVPAVEGQPCRHAHDGTCGYIPAAPGQPCGYICKLCPIEKLIAALPPRVTEDNRDAVTARLQELLDLYAALDEAEQDQLDLSPALRLQEELEPESQPEPLTDITSYLTEETGLCPHHPAHTGCTYNPEDGTKCNYVCRKCFLSTQQYITVNNGEALEYNFAKSVTIADGGSLINNYGSISTIRSGGSLTNNYGSVSTNLGTIQTNCSGSSVSANRGTIENNGNGANVFNNEAGGTVTGNRGKVGSNYGIVKNNYNEVTSVERAGVVNSNAGRVGTVSNGGGVSMNEKEGTIDSCSGHVNYNRGTITSLGSGGEVATNWGTIENNHAGTVEFSSGMINYNYSDGTVNDNSGTINYNSGTVKTNTGTIYYALTVTGDNSDHLTFTGLSDDKRISGKRGASFTINRGWEVSGAPTATGCTVTDSGGGSYRLENVTGDVTLNISLTAVPPVITTQPADVEMFVGEDKTLSVGAAPDTVSYQWYKTDGAGETEISGAQSASLSLKDFTAGTYQIFCRLTNGNNHLDSKTVTVTVQQQRETALTVQADHGEYTYGDTITVTAAAAAKTASVTNGLAEGSGQMALFYNDVQVTEPVSMGQDGMFTMSVSVRDLLNNAFPTEEDRINTYTKNPDSPHPVTLTARYAGSASMAGAEGTVDVILKQKPVTVSLTQNTFTKEYDGASEFTVEAKYMAINGSLDGDDVRVADSVAYLENTDVGTYDINVFPHITGKDSINYFFSSAVTATLTITQKPLDESEYKAALTSSSNTFPFTGSPVEPGVTVAVDPDVLPEEAYSVTYANNTSPGTASATVQSTETSNYKFGPKTLEFIIVCAHPGMTDDGMCTVCGQEIAATVDADGKTSYFTDITSAWNAATGKTATITMLRDQHISECLEITEGNVMLTMKPGVELTGEITTAELIRVGGSASLTLQDCTLEVSRTPSSGYSVSCVYVGYDGASLNITNCTITASSAGDSYAVYATRGAATIHSGTFQGTTGFRFSPATGGTRASVYGGTFISTNSGGAIQIVNAPGTNYTVGSILGDNDLACKTGDGSWLTGEALNITAAPSGVEVLPIPVKITNQSTGGTATYGVASETALDVMAETDTGMTITYQWYQKTGEGDKEVPGQTTGTLTVPAGLGPVGEYTFYCAVTCDGCTVNSAPGTVSVKPKEISIKDAALKEREYSPGDTSAEVESVTFDGLVNNDMLTPGTDYTATAKYEDPNAGTGKSATGSVELNAGSDKAKNFKLTGTTFETTGTVNPKTITDPTVKVTGSYPYTGRPVTPAPENVEVSYSENDTTTVVPSGEYEYACTGNTAAGQATLTVKAKEGGNYLFTGNCSTTFTIAPASLESAEVEFTGTLTYNGSARTPDPSQVTVTIGGAALEPGTDYTVESAGEAINTGDYSAKVIGAGSFSGEKEFPFTISPATLPEMSLAQDSAVYNGSEQKPEVTISGLAEGTDFDVTYTRGGAETDDFTNAGEILVTATGKGNYTGTSKKTYTIGKATPQIAWSDSTQTLTYTGKAAVITAPTVTLVGSDTFSGTIRYSYVEDGKTFDGLPTDAGTYKVTASIDEADNYTAADSENKLTLIIEKATPTLEFVSGYNPGKEFDGTAIPAPANSDLTVTGVPFEEVSFKWTKDGAEASPINAGTYTLTASIGETGNTNPVSAALDVTIAPKTLDSSAITLEQDSYEYTGSAITPNVTVRDAELNYTLQADEYAVEYKDNTEHGTATVTIKDAEGGNYTFSPITAEFTITNRLLSSEKAAVTVAPGTYTYNGEAQEPAVTVTYDGEAVPSGEYTVSYADNTNAGKATITVTAKAGGNYSGSNSATFTISPKPVTAVVTAASRHFDGTRNATVTAEVSSADLASGDSITITGLTGTFDNENAGTGKTVAVDSSKAVITGNETGNYDIAFPAATTADIERAAVTIIWSSAEQNTIYSGSQAAITDPTVSAENGVSVSVIPEYSYKQGEANFTEGLPIHAGTYIVRASIAESDNLTAASADMTLTIAPKEVTDPAITTSPASYEYDGTAKKPAVTVMDGSTSIDPGEYTVEYSSNTNAGTAAVKITDSNPNGNYVITEKSAAFTITEASISGAEVTVSGSYTYNGTAHEPASVTVKLGEKTLTAGTDYTVETTNNVNAGEAIVTVTGTGNYKDTAAGKFPIAKAALTADGAGTASGTYGKTLSELTVEGLTATLNGTPVSGSWALSGDTIPNVGDGGKYTAAFTPDSGWGNYHPLTAQVTLRIAKATYPGTTAVNTSGKYGAAGAYDLSDLLPLGSVLGTVTTSDANSIFAGAPSVTGTTLNYKLADSEGNIGKTGVITVPVDSSANYNAFSLTITVTVINAQVPDLSVNSIDVIYTGSPVPDSSITGTATVDGKSLAGKWSFASGQAITNADDSGTKQVIFTPDEKDHYGIGHGTVLVTIRKATPQLTLKPSPDALPNGGTVTLTLSGLPSGGSATVTCSDKNISIASGADGTWTAAIPSGGASYTFTASYAGDGNHNGAAAACTVSVEKAAPALSLKASHDALKGGGAVTLTLSGLPAGETASVTCSGGINVEKGAGNTWTATLPNSNGTYTFTASYAGSAAYQPASAACTVKTNEVVILDPPAGDDKTQFQLTMETGISEVPAELKNIENLETPEKLETAMKTAITQVNTGIPQERTSVYDAELLVSKDGGATWIPATKDNFPSQGLTITLPYPDGTDSSYRFTVVHMFTTSDFGKKPGDTEVFTPNQVKNTAKGIQFVVTGLSPISVGWEKTGSPSNPSGGSPSSDGSSSGGYEDSGYAITVKRSEHGKVTSSCVNADSGNPVTLTVTPDSGYVLDTLTVTDSRGSELKLTDKGGGKYTFTMPSRTVTVTATFAPLPPDAEQPCDGGADCPSRAFTDLNAGTWYHEAVDYVLRNGLMNGYGGGLFGPDENLSRAQLAQILYNHAGRPAVTGASPFTDAANGEWYTAAITWAAAQGVVGGYGNGLFGPNDNITREQLAVMLWRYAGSPAATNKELHFNDIDEADGYALEALRWAVEHGILNGYGDGRLNPAGLATRAQVAAMLMRYIEGTQE